MSPEVAISKQAINFTSDIVLVFRGAEFFRYRKAPPHHITPQVKQTLCDVAIFHRDCAYHKIPTKSLVVSEREAASLIGENVGSCLEK